MSVLFPAIYVGKSTPKSILILHVIVDFYSSSVNVKPSQFLDGYDKIDNSTPPLIPSNKIKHHTARPYIQEHFFYDMKEDMR